MRVGRGIRGRVPAHQGAAAELPREYGEDERLHHLQSSGSIRAPAEGPGTQMTRRPRRARSHIVPRRLPSGGGRNPSPARRAAPRRARSSLVSHSSPRPPARSNRLPIFPSRASDRFQTLRTLSECAVDHTRRPSPTRFATTTVGTPSWSTTVRRSSRDARTVVPSGSFPRLPPPTGTLLPDPTLAPSA